MKVALLVLLVLAIIFVPLMVLGLIFYRLTVSWHCHEGDPYFDDVDEHRFY